MGHHIDVVSKEERNVCTNQNQNEEIWSCKKKQMDHIRKRFTCGELCSSREKCDKGTTRESFLQNGMTRGIKFHREMKSAVAGMQ